MVTGSSQRLKILYLKKILLERTDEAHPMTVAELITALSHYGVKAERKSIYTDIELLQDTGLDIVCEKGQSNRYYVASREFELVELKLLVDSVQASKFITHRKSSELIKKLEKHASIHEARALHRQVIVRDRVKTMNESVYYNVDAIHQAIQENRMIEFQYFDYDLDKKLQLRRNGERYLVSPFALTWVDDHYYLLAHHDRYPGISHFRVDRMIRIEICEEGRKNLELFEGLNIAEYSKQVFGMFTGHLEKVEIEFSNPLINVVIDKFGKNISIHSRGEGVFRISADVVVSTTFFSWMFLFGGEARVIGPPHVRQKLKEYLDDIVAQYS